MVRIRYASRYVFDHTVRQRHPESPYSDAELEAAAAEVDSDRSHYEDEAEWMGALERVAERAAEATRRQAAEREAELAWEVERRLRNEVSQIHREAGIENALFNYNQLVGDLLPKLMCVDFDLLPRENQNTVVNLLYKTHQFLDGKLYKKSPKQYARFCWARLDEDDDDD
jgi:hypothetical protein